MTYVFKQILKKQQLFCETSTGNEKGIEKSNFKLELWLVFLFICYNALLPHNGSVVC